MIWSSFRNISTHIENNRKYLASMDVLFDVSHELEKIETTDFDALSKCKNS